jgi:hypothetical protein
MEEVELDWNGRLFATMAQQRKAPVCRHLRMADMRRIDVKRKSLSVLIAVLIATSNFGWAAAPADMGDDNSSESAAIIDKYLQASQSHEEVLRGASMEVDIDASVPRLKKNGRLHALRNISKVGQITYRVLGFQGDNTVKKEVIARYLTAEQQAQSDNKLAITPANYKFKFKGRKQLENGGNIYVFQLAPRKKQVGLFKGEIWLDEASYLPIFEKGRFVKNPSIFFKKVDFERAFAIRDGVAIPQRMTSTIDARIFGKVQLNVNYTNFEQQTTSSSSEGYGAEAVLNSYLAK